MLQDKTVLVASEPLRQLIEALAEDEILHGSAYEGQKKYLAQYCQTEGIDFSALDSALMSLFKAAADYKANGSVSSEQRVNQIGQRCYLSTDAINKLLLSLKSIRSQEEAAQKKKEQAAARRKASAKKDSKADENRKLLQSNELFNTYPAIRKELLSFVNNNNFESEYLTCQSLLKELEKTCLIISETRQGLDSKNPDHLTLWRTSGSFLEKRKSLHFSEINSAYREGQKLLDQLNQLRQKEKKLGRILTPILFLGITLLITRWVFSPTSVIESLWVRWAIEIIVILFFLYKLYDLFFSDRD